MKFYIQIAIIAIIATIIIVSIPSIYFLGVATTWAHAMVIAEWLSNVNPIFFVAVISLFALNATIKTSKGWQRHNRLSIQPYLAAQMKTSKTEAAHDPNIKLECLEIKVVNRGIGPAVITDFTLFFAGEPLADNDHKDYQIALKEKIMNKSVGKSTTIELTSILKSDIIAIGEEQVVLKIQYDPKDENDETVDKFYQLDLQIKYQSMYEIDMQPCDTRD